MSHTSSTIKFLLTIVVNTNSFFIIFRCCTFKISEAKYDISQVCFTNKKNNVLYFDQQCLTKFLVIEDHFYDQNGLNNIQYLKNFLRHCQDILQSPDEDMCSYRLFSGIKNRIFEFLNSFFLIRLLTNT